MVFLNFPDLKLLIGEGLSEGLFVGSVLALVHSTRALPQQCEPIATLAHSNGDPHAVWPAQPAPAAPPPPAWQCRQEFHAHSRLMFAERRQWCRACSGRTAGPYLPVGRPAPASACRPAGRSDSILSSAAKGKCTTAHLGVGTLWI
jgi:hypothetical protein